MECSRLVVPTVVSDEQLQDELKNAKEKLNLDQQVSAYSSCGVWCR